MKTSFNLIFYFIIIGYATYLSIIDKITSAEQFIIIMLALIWLAIIDKKKK